MQQTHSSLSTAAAADHTGCHSCELRTGNWGYNWYGLPLTGQQKIGKMLPGLLSLNFCSDTQIVGSEFGVNNMKTWIHPVLYQRFRLVVVCDGIGDLFLAHSGPLNTNWTLFKHHSLPKGCCWRCPSSDQTGFLNMTVSSVYLNAHHSRQNLIQ